MNNKLNEKMSLGEIVARYPQTRMTLEKLGLDYCCGGKTDLKTAAQAKSISAGHVIEELNRAIQESRSQNADDHDWTSVPLTELCDHIEAKHHTYMKENLPRIWATLEKVIRAHGEKHGTMLRDLANTFSSLRSEIEMHLMKEEQILFPYIRQIEAYATGTGPMPQVHCGSVENPINQMEHEHDSAGEALAHMRQITNDYTAPADACQTFCGLYEALDAIEKDLHQHIHLENNILFPKAVSLESCSCKFE